MVDEITALHTSGTWELVVWQVCNGLPLDVMVKYLPDGTVECYKAHLVAMGYTHAYGINYARTFSPVAMIGSIHIFISLVDANLVWPL